MSSLPAKPAKDPVWATTPGTDPISGNSYLQAPTDLKAATGWVQEKPPLQWFNSWMNLVYQWVIWAVYRNPLSNIVAVTASGTTVVALGRSIYIFANCTTGNQTFTLPTPVAGTDDGMVVRIKRLDASGNTITWGGTVEGVASPTIDQQYTEEAVIAYNALWYWIA